MSEVPVTVPMPGSIFRLVAPVTVQASVLDWPLAIPTGVAVKLLITGFGPIVTVTVDVLVP